MNEYLKVQLEKEEFLMFKGQWSITEYIDESVEYHGVDTDAEEYKALNKKVTDEIIDKYLGETLNINEENISSFGPPNELGFYCEEWSDLFMQVRHPPIVSEALSPPFVCASMKFKKYKNDYLDIILDKNNEAILYANLCYFKLKKTIINSSADYYKWL